MLLFERLKGIRAFVFDVDGVLTNGQVLVTESGEQLRSFNIKDGYALQLAIRRNYPLAIITGARSEGVRLRMEGLGIRSVYLNASDKSAVLATWMEENNLRKEDLLVMGDDVPDLPIMEGVRLAACPDDAIEDMKQKVHYISAFKGGQGAVRDVIEKVMRLQGTWDANPEIKSV